MKETYLKCVYSPGNLSTEYFVQFNGSQYPAAPFGGVYVVKRM